RSKRDWSSDVCSSDLLGEDSARLVRAALAGAERELRRSINEHVMTTQEWKARLSKGDPFLSNVRTEPKLWVTGDEDELVRLDPRRRKRRVGKERRSGR